MTRPLLQIRHLTKSFPGLRALDDVSLSVNAGEIVAVVGQNGSGKSTLAKILAGVYKPDDGAQVEIDGEAVDLPTQRLYFIHQELGLVPQLTTVENLDLARRLGSSALRPFRRGAERRAAVGKIAAFGSAFDVNVPIAELTPAERTIVAIARALGGWTQPDNVLVLDEPTEALHGFEVEKLFEAVRRLAHSGAGVVFISHRLEEVMALADRVVILRDGRIVGELSREEFDRAALVRLIVGAELRDAVLEHAPKDGPPLLRVRGLRGQGIRNLDMAVRPGEIVGISGLMGSGREHVAGVLFGAVKRDGGQVLVEDVPVGKNSPNRSTRMGVAYVPGDRKTHGLVMTMCARENLTLPELPTSSTLRWQVDRARERLEMRDWMSRVDLRPARPEQEMRLFSGGNQQKIVLAKWLRLHPKVLLLDEPTQGVDVGAKAAIYALIEQVANDGAAVVVCSSDARELTVLCDRVIVLRDGVASTELERSELSEAELTYQVIGIGDTSIESGKEFA